MRGARLGYYGNGKGEKDQNKSEIYLYNLAHNRYNADKGFFLWVRKSTMGQKDMSIFK